MLNVYLCIAASYKCGPQEYACLSDGKCIPITKVCDNKNDCSQRDDEGATCSKFY